MLGSLALATKKKFGEQFWLQRFLFGDFSVFFWHGGANKIW
jgi:hypothetical protein